MGKFKWQSIVKTSNNLFWKPSLATARIIDDSDTVLALESARVRFAQNMADLERAFESRLLSCARALSKKFRSISDRARNKMADHPAVLVALMAAGLSGLIVGAAATAVLFWLML
jgi:hypothetical protein